MEYESHPGEIYHIIIIIIIIIDVCVASCKEVLPYHTRPTRTELATCFLYATLQRWCYDI